MFFVGIENKKFGPFDSLTKCISFCDLTNLFDNVYIGYWKNYPEYAYTYDKAKQYVVTYNKKEW